MVDEPAGRAVSVNCAAESVTVAIVNASKLPVSSYTRTVMPAVKPQRFVPTVQPGSTAACSVSSAGIRSAPRVVCAEVDNTEMIVMVSVRKVPTASSPETPWRNGSTGAK